MWCVLSCSCTVYHASLSASCTRHDGMAKTCRLTHIWALLDGITDMWHCALYTSRAEYQTQGRSQGVLRGLKHPLGSAVVLVKLWNLGVSFPWLWVWSPQNAQIRDEHPPPPPPPPLWASRGYALRLEIVCYMPYYYHHASCITRELRKSYVR